MAHHPTRPRAVASATTLCLAGGQTGCSAGQALSPTAAPATPTSTATAASTSTSPTVGPGLGVVPHVVTTVEPSVGTAVTKAWLGSGVIYKPDGTIVTGAHVVENQQKKPFTAVLVQFADGKQAADRVIGVEDITDVAVIKAGRTGLPTASLEATLPRVGALAVVIGSPSAGDRYGRQYLEPAPQPATQ